MPASLGARAWTCLRAIWVFLHPWGFAGQWGGGGGRDTGMGRPSRRGARPLRLGAGTGYCTGSPLRLLLVSCPEIPTAGPGWGAVGTLDVQGVDPHLGYKIFSVH